MSASSSHDLFMQQLMRCVKHQPDGIEPGPTITSAESELYAGTGQILPMEDIGTGAGEAHVDQLGVWGLRPPGDERDEPPIVIGDWA